jgi:hypothetical protein
MAADSVAFAPVVTEAIFRDAASAGAPVNVPLVMVRLVAELPSHPSAAEMAERLRRRIDALQKERRASFAWSPSVHTGTDLVSPGTVELFFREETMRVWGKASLEKRAGASALLLDANAALLLQGTLNLFVHVLDPLVHPAGQDSATPNRDVAALVEWAREGIAQGKERLVLFEAPLADRYGRHAVLRAAWEVKAAHCAWEWEVDGTAPAAYLDVRQSSWVSGFITLVRVAYPGEWAWRADGAQ